MNNQDISSFFYAEYEAGMYNDTVVLTTPLYRQAIDVLMKLVTEHCKVIVSPCSISLLDIGAGTGNESISLMENIPNLCTVAVDFCAPMKDEYFDHFMQKGMDERRVDYIVSDIFDLDNHALSEANGGKKFQVVISAYALHHYSLLSKKGLFRRIYELLEEGGIFINLDLFCFKSPAVANLANEEIFSFIRNEFDHPSEEFAAARKISATERERLKNMWLKHYAVDNKLTPIEGQVEDLTDVGFRDVSVPFMYLQNGLVWAIK